MQVTGNHILLRHRDIADLDTLSVYENDGGYATWKKVVTSMEPNAVVEEVFHAGLGVRGGAGGPSGCSRRSR